MLRHPRDHRRHAGDRGDERGGDWFPGYWRGRFSKTTKQAASLELDLSQARECRRETEAIPSPAVNAGQEGLDQALVRLAAHPSPDKRAQALVRVAVASRDH